MTKKKVYITLENKNERSRGMKKRIIKGICLALVLTCVTTVSTFAGTITGSGVSGVTVTRCTNYYGRVFYGF